MDTEVLGDLGQGHAVFTGAGDADDVVAELLGVRAGTATSFQAALWASQIRYHQSVQQSPRAPNSDAEGGVAVSAETTSGVRLDVLQRPSLIAVEQSSTLGFSRS